MSKHNNFFPWTTKEFLEYEYTRRISMIREGWRRRGEGVEKGEEDAEEARLYRLGRHIEALWGGATPLLLDRGCLWLAILAVRQPASQPASQPSRKRVEEEGGIMEVRTRIVRDQKVEILRGVVRERDPFIMEMSRQRSKRWGEGEDFFFVVLIWSHGDEWRKNNTNRDIEFAVFIVKRGERTLFPVYFYTLWRMN